MIIFFETSHQKVKILFPSYYISLKSPLRLHNRAIFPVTNTYFCKSLFILCPFMAKVNRGRNNLYMDAGPIYQKSVHINSLRFMFYKRFYSILFILQVHRGLCSLCVCRHHKHLKYRTILRKKSMFFFRLFMQKNLFELHVFFRAKSYH